MIEWMGKAMNTTTPLEEVLALALKLAPKERLQLIEQVASSVERDIEDSAEKQPASRAKTGAEIVAMLEAMDPIEFVDPEIEDPVEWVKAQRRKRADKLKPYREGDL
jgi:hypothetical protein